MRTNIVIDDQLIGLAMRKSGFKTKREAVDAALRHFVAEPDYSGLLQMLEAGGVAEGYDPKAGQPDPWRTGAR